MVDDKFSNKQMNNKIDLPWDPPQPSEAGTQGFSEQEDLNFYFLFKFQLLVFLFF